MVDYRNTPVEDLIRSQIQSEEEFTDQHSFHFKLCIAINFDHYRDKSDPSFDLLFGTVLTKLKFFHMVKNNLPCLTNFRNCLL